MTGNNSNDNAGNQGGNIGIGNQGDHANNNMGDKVGGQKGDNTSYRVGDRVKYRPIGGAEENVATSTGVINDINFSHDSAPQYAIKNDSTGETTIYQNVNIVQKINN
ncbi:hypothetical protein C8Q80DRAFT_1162601 [Daedaleopsis nitida]|nr:hypothetical protein C8Q80DRAFT_1162601 [Daedaleopsis nitida]